MRGQVIDVEHETEHAETSAITDEALYRIERDPGLEEPAMQAS